MISFTTAETASTTFTRSHAKHISARIAADLARMTAFYPTGLTDQRIIDFQNEAIEYLCAGYLETVTYGFKKETEDWYGDKQEEWVLALKYVVRDGDLEGGSSTPGGIKPGIDIAGTSFCSFLIQNSKYFDLGQASREKFKQSLPIVRTAGEEPNASWRKDRAYGQGGRYVDRLTTGF